MTAPDDKKLINDLAQEIRRVDSNWSLGAGELAKALAPFISARLEALTAPQVEPAGWSYEFHEFGEVWKRNVILNRPDGGASPPTKHNGSEVRNVRPLYTHPATDRGELVEARDEIEMVRAKVSGDDGYNYPAGQEYGLRQAVIILDRRIAALAKEGK